MHLDEIQQLFFRAITWPTGVSDFLAQADLRTRQAFDAAFAESAELGRVERLDVYANAYFYRLLDALREMFPRTCALAGEAAFHNLVTDYLLAFPSCEPDLRHAGDALPGFSAAHALGRELPMAADVARVEQALNHSLDAPQGGKVERQALAIVEPTAWPLLHLDLSTPTRLVRVDWDVAEIARCLEGDAPESARQLARSPVPLTFLVGRLGFATYFRRLGAVEATALTALARGDSFGAACEAVSRASPEVELSSLARDLMRWLDDGVIGAMHRG
jgi:hypothetical protein